MSTVRRRRLVAAAVALALVAAAAVLIARALGGGPPEDELAALVPASALVYVHASTDPGRDADAALVRRLEQLPALRAARDAAVARIGGQSRGFSFARDIRPWLGDEAALALLPSPARRTADALVLAAVRERDLARVFVARAGARRVGVHRGVDVLDLGEVSAAVAEDVLMIGQAAGVRSAIDLQQGRGRALAGEPAFARTEVEGLEDRVVEAHATGDGIRGVLAPLLGPLAGVLDGDAGVEAVRAAMAPDPAGVRVRARTVRRRGAPRRAAFEPALVRAAPADAAGVLGLTSADPLVRRLLAGAPGLEAAARGAGVDVERDLLAPLRGGEVALWGTPGDPLPGLALAARTRDPARTREALGRLQGPLAALLTPGDEEAGQVPLFEQRDVAGVPAFSLALAPGTELTYAIFGSTLVLGTGPAAVEQVRRGRPGLIAAAQAQKRIGIPANGAEAIVFIRPEQLLALGDLLGVTADPAVQAVRDDVSRLRAVSGVAQREETDTTAELLFQIP